MTTTVPESATEVVRRVHSMSYRFPEGFPGFRADVAWEVDDTTGEAGCAVRPGPHVELSETLPGSGWVAGELRSIMGHHQPVTAGRSRSSAPTHGGGANHSSPVVVELGDELDTSYGVRDDEIETLTRTMGERRFTIVVQERMATPDHTSLATRYAVFFWDVETGALAEVDSYHDVWAPVVDGLLLPVSREVVRGTSQGIVNRRLALSGHELVTGARS